MLIFPTMILRGATAAEDNEGLDAATCFFLASRTAGGGSDVAGRVGAVAVAVAVVVVVVVVAADRVCRGMGGEAEAEEAEEDEDDEEEEEEEAADEKALSCSRCSSLSDASSSAWSRDNCRAANSTMLLSRAFAAACNNTSSFSSFSLPSSPSPSPNASVAAVHVGR